MNIQQSVFVNTQSTFEIIH